MSPEISVIIPCYNCAAFLSDAIVSVLDQDFQNWELILVDDHSTDDTMELAKSFQLKYTDKIHVYLNPKKGASAARNYGFSIAKGKYIQFLDADDLILPGKFNAQLFIFQDTKSDVVVSDYIVSDFNTQKKISHHTFEMLDSNILYCLLRNVVGSGNPIYKTEMVKKIGGYNEKLTSAQDWDFHLRLYFSEAKFSHHAGDFFQIRKVNDSLSSSWIKVYEQACEYLPELKTSIQTDKHFTLQCSQYIASLYHLTLIHSKLTAKRPFYRNQMREWSGGNFDFLSSRLKKGLVFVTGFRFLEFLERIRIKFRR